MRRLSDLSPAPDGMGESQLTTVMPASAAACVAGSSWSPALLDTMIASTPWVTALVTNSTCPVVSVQVAGATNSASATPSRSEEHTSELQSLMRISYAVFCLQKKIT